MWLAQSFLTYTWSIYERRREGRMGKNYIIFTVFIFQNIIRFNKSWTLNWQDARRRWEMRKKFNPKEEGNQRLGTPGSWWEENTKIDFMRTDVRARSCYNQLTIGSRSWYCEQCTEEPVYTEGRQILSSQISTKLSSNTFHHGHRHIFISR